MTPETAAKIAAEFHRREADAGGYASADLHAIAHEVARDFGLTYEDVRAVLIEHWAGTMGAG
ncbi:MAG: hypothetical protein D6811_10175 [Alphaproteobacteria bacterium]|nr:MAG: hypothetical protein D6811_10175 [Alphaproteobacteria bacterium]